MVVAGALLMMASGTAVAGVKMLSAGATKQGSLLGSARAHSGGDITGPLNFLIIGSNYRADDPSNGERADTIMIMHVPKDMTSAYLVSVPRELYYTIKPDKSVAPNYDGGTERIDDALTYGGMKFMAETVSDLTGIKFDGAAEARFSGFDKAVEDLGGIRMCVDEKTVSVHTGWDAQGHETKPFSNTGGTPEPIPGVTPMVYYPGCQFMKPWQALDYVRQRETLPNGDFDRQRHEQQFIAAVLEQVATKGTLSDPIKLDKVVNDIGQAITTDTNAPTVDLAYALRGIRSQDLTGLKCPTHAIKVDGQDFVQADPGMTDLWKALHDDTLDKFALSHPDLVNPLHPGG